MEVLLIAPISAHYSHEQQITVGEEETKAEADHLKWKIQASCWLFVFSRTCWTITTPSVDNADDKTSEANDEVHSEKIEEFDEIDPDECWGNQKSPPNPFNHVINSGNA